MQDEKVSQAQMDRSRVNALNAMREARGKLLVAYTNLKLLGEQGRTDAAWFLHGGAERLLNELEDES